MVRSSSTDKSPLMNMDSLMFAVMGKCIQFSDPQVEQTRLPVVERDNLRVASQSAHNTTRSSNDLLTLEWKLIADLPSNTSSQSLTPIWFRNPIVPWTKSGRKGRTGWLSEFFRCNSQPVDTHRSFCELCRT